MAKPRDTVVLGLRVPIATADAVYAKAGGKERFPELFRSILQAIVGGHAPSRGAAQLEGFEEGKRQGWAHANKVFREALNIALGKLKG